MAINLSRARAWLNSSKLQTTNPPLYQTIKELINQIDSVILLISSSGSSSGIANANEEYLVSTSALPDLPNSRVVIAGTNITVDASIPGQFTISSGGGGSWDVLTNGDTNNPEFIFASGEVIMVFTP